jgi:hypothetical protein
VPSFGEENILVTQGPPHGAEGRGYSPPPLPRVALGYAVCGTDVTSQTNTTAMTYVNDLPRTATRERTPSNR